MRRGNLRRALAAAVIVICTAIASAGERTVLLDFETGEPSDGWKSGGLALHESSVPQDVTPSGGRALTFVAKGAPRNGRIGYARHDVEVNDWRGYDALSFYAKVEADAPVKMRIMGYRAPGPASLLRRFVLEPGPWREVRLPLRDFRQDTVDQVCDFSRIDLVLFRWDDTPGRVTIDDVALIPGERGVRSSVPTPEDRMAVAFPDGDGRSYSNDHFLILTNAPKLDDTAATALLEQLEQAFSVLRDVYGVQGELASRAPLVVFATHEQYVAYFERLGAHYGLGIGAPKSQGLAVLGLGVSSWSDEYGWDRPTFIHETMHAVIYRLLGVTNSPNWVQEGLAAGVQSRVYPAAVAAVDFPKLFEQHALGDGGFRAFGELFAREGAPMSRYPQYLSIMDFLADQHRDQLASIWEAVRGMSGKVHETAAPDIAKALGFSMTKFEKMWARWGAEYYRGRDDLNAARDAREKSGEEK